MDMNLDHLRSWIGREERETETLTPVLAQRFYATYDREGPLDKGAEAPLLLHHCLCQPAAPTAMLGPDGHPRRGGFLPPVPLPRRMWAGGALEFHAPLRIGEEVTRHSVIEDVTIKDGRSGTLCFVTVSHRYSSGGLDAITERQDIVYRHVGTPGAAPKSSPPPAAEGEHRREMPSSTPLLFRYSALTFNSHRIHYDLPYTKGEEGYPGLVVQGPLQALLLAQFAADLHGATPTRFRFRSLSPVFDGPGFSLNATRDGDTLRLWTAMTDGPVAMEAFAEW